jgi:hypothetical protein
MLTWPRLTQDRVTQVTRSTDDGLIWVKMFLGDQRLWLRNRCCQDLGRDTGSRLRAHPSEPRSLVSKRKEDED